MDEMMNMNETTMENEASVEVVPEENVQMIAAAVGMRTVYSI